MNRFDWIHSQQHDFSSLPAVSLLFIQAFSAITKTPSAHECGGALETCLVLNSTPSSSFSASSSSSFSRFASHNNDVILNFFPSYTSCTYFDSRYNENAVEIQCQILNRNCRLQCNHLKCCYIDNNAPGNGNPSNKREWEKEIGMESKAEHHWTVI